MCGICGWVGAPADSERLDAMVEALTHRGPDDRGTIAGDQVSLGMRRLSIVDRAGGRQPLANEDGSVVVVFNGELYTHRELRRGLEARGHHFRTSSDAEVLVHLWEEHREDLLQHLRGMFAFALWDRRDDTVLLARDRLGVKPLYLAPGPGGSIVFASELQALLRHPAVAPEVSPLAVDDFLALRYVPGPGSIVRGVRRLPAGGLLLWRRGRIDERRWWSLPELDPAQSTTDDHLERFAATFEEAVKLRTMGEVPVGAYLSGGLDSGTITAALVASGERRLETFCVGFGWEGDELDSARRTATALGTTHHDVTCSPADLGALRQIVRHLGDPQGDAIVLPTWRLAAAARERVTVVQSGDGADEVLGGYLFHRVLLLAARYRSAMPGSVHRGLVAPLARHTPQWLLEALFDYPGQLGRQGRERVLAALSLLESSDVRAGWRFLITLFAAEERNALYHPDFAAAVRSARAERTHPAYGPAPLERMLELQLEDWLPDNILQRADALSMAHGLELRVPFLDHVLVEQLHRVPLEELVGPRRGKLLLRRYAADRKLPVGLAGRRKRPFYIPLERWGRDPHFLGLLEETVSPEVVRRRGVFDPAAVATLRRRLDAGDFLSFKKVFALVMLELWFQEFTDRPAAAVRSGAFGGLRDAA